MDIIPAAGNAAAQAANQDSGPWWNPLPKLTKTVSSLGSWVDAHTKIGSFNPGIGALSANVANMLPGLASSALTVTGDVLTGHEGEAVHQLGLVGSGMYHGFLDTATDVLTGGGLLPGTQGLENAIGQLPGHYTPSSLRQYATSPGQGLGGALFNDAANVAMVADGVGALAKAGTVGEAAEAAMKAETAGKIAGASDPAANLTEIANRGNIGREAKIAEQLDQVREAGGDTVAARQRILDRMQAMDRINVAKNAAQTIVQPWRALRPFERAATALHGAEEPSGTPVPENAPRPSEGHTAPLTATERTAAAAQGLSDLAGGGVKLATSIPPPAPGMIRLYNGGAGRADVWTRDINRAEAYRNQGVGAESGQVKYVDVPADEAAKLQTRPGTEAYDEAVAQPGGNMPHPQNDYWLADSQHLVDEGFNNPRVAAPGAGPAQSPGQPATLPHEPVTVPPVAGDSPPPHGSESAADNASTLVGYFKNLSAEDVPRAYKSYLDKSNPIPKWALTAVSHIPAPMRQVLVWMDNHHDKLDYQVMTRQQQRALAVSAKEIENRPEVQAIKAEAQRIVQQRLPGIGPAEASNIASQVVSAYVTHGVDLIENLEKLRTEAEAIMPGLIDSQLHYTIHIPDELNTPEFRQQMYTLAEPYKQLRLAASQAMRDSRFLAEKGLPVNEDMPVLTTAELRLFNQANHKLLQASNLEDGAVKRQLEGLAKDRALAADKVANAVKASDLALQDMVEAKTDFDRSRYVPQGVNTPRKLLKAANDIYKRTMEKGSAVFDPHEGRFLTSAEPGSSGHLVGALDHSVVTVPLDQLTPEMIGHFIQSYQEAYQFPSMMVNVWADDSGNAHIDPVEHLAGDSSRAQAMILASVRGQDTVKDMATGENIPVHLDPNVSAYFLDQPGRKPGTGSYARTRTYLDLAATNDRIKAEGGTGLAADDIDAAMRSFDRMAVVQHLLHGDKYKSADEVYRTFKIEYGTRASGKGLNEIRMMVPEGGTQALKQAIAPLIKAGTEETKWYFQQHDMVEKLLTHLPETMAVGWSPLGDHKVVNTRELLYSLVATNSLRNKPQNNIADALGAFRNIALNRKVVQESAKALQEWAKLPPEDRVNTGWKAGEIPEVLRPLLDGARNLSMRETLAVLDGHLVGDWDHRITTEVLPQYGFKLKGGEKFDRGKVPQDLIDRFGGDTERASMEYYGGLVNAKFRSYYDNLIDPDHSTAVTLDEHMGRLWGKAGTLFSTPGNWIKYADQVRQIATELSAEYGRTVMPHEVQAALWYWEKEKTAEINHANWTANFVSAKRMVQQGTWTKETDPGLQEHQYRAGEAMQPPGEKGVFKRKLKMLHREQPGPVLIGTRGSLHMIKGAIPPDQIIVHSGRFAVNEVLDNPNPDSLYHGTTAGAAAKIKEEGLKTGEGPHAQTGYTSGTSDPSEAVGYAGEARNRGQYQGKDNQPALIEFPKPPEQAAAGTPKTETVQWSPITGSVTNPGTATNASQVSINAANEYERMLDKTMAEAEAAATKAEAKKPGTGVDAYKARMTKFFDNELKKNEKDYQSESHGGTFAGGTTYKRFVSAQADLEAAFGNPFGALNEFRDEVVGQFRPNDKVAGGTIALFKGADIGTLLHEQGHLLRALTTGEDAAALERAYGVVGHRWTADQEEAFVHDFLAQSSDVRYAGMPEMDRLKQVLAQVYGDFGPSLHPEIDHFWQSTLAPQIAAVRQPGFTLSTGEKITGLQGKSELPRFDENGRQVAGTMAQRQQSLPNVSANETPMEAYKRGIQGQASIDKWADAARRRRAGQQAAARAQSAVDKLEKDILERHVPAMKEAANYTRQAAKQLDKLYERLDDPAISRVPPKWQPMVESARQLARAIEQYPELEPIMADFPKTFGEAMDYAAERGFTPEYMPQMNASDVRKLIAGTAQLGNTGTAQVGQEFTSAARKQRTGSLQRVGGQEQSIEALIAGLNQSVQENRTNMVVNWIDRAVAHDLPVENGRRLGAPPGWVEWDQTRRGLLGLETQANGRIAVGATKMIPKPVADALREYSGPPPTNPLYRGLKMVTDPWRTLMLTLNPGFYLKHFQGHILLAAIAGGTDLSAWADAWKAARSGANGRVPIRDVLFKGLGYHDLPEVTGQNIVYNELGQPAILHPESVREAARIGTEQGGTLGGFNAGRHSAAQTAHNVIGATDSFARAVAYFANKHKGYSNMEALQYAMDAVIDYGNLSNFERYWVRSLIPFYSFEKGVAKIVMSMPYEHPLATSVLMSLSKIQEDQAVDAKGNPLPERYQGVVNLPLLGPTDMQKFSPFKDFAALTTPEGLVQSLQFAVQDVVRAGTGLAAPGTKATVKIDKYGRLVPNVTLPSQLAASFSGGPQGQVIQGGPLSHFLGLPTVSQATLDRAGARNTLALGELAAASTAEQQKAAASPVDTLALQQNLVKQQAGGATPLPQNQGANEPTITQAQLEQAVNDAVAAQKARAAATRAANGTSSSGTRKHYTRLRHGFSHRARTFRVKRVRVGGRSF